MKKKLFLVKGLLVVSILVSTAYAKTVEGMVLSVTEKEIVIVTKEGKKEVFRLPPLKVKDKSREDNPSPKPGYIVILKVKKNRVEEIKIKGIPQ